MKLAQKNVKLSDKEKPGRKTSFRAMRPWEIKKTGTALGFLATQHSKCVLLKLLVWFSSSFMVLSNLAAAARMEAPHLQMCTTDTDRMVVAAGTSLWIVNITHPIETKEKFTVLPFTNSRNSELSELSGLLI